MALLQIALDKEVRVRNVGEPTTGRVMQPVYVFDRLVIPVGTVAVGRISAIEPVSARKRTLDALNADFTPYHKLTVLFDGARRAPYQRRKISSVNPGHPIHTRYTSTPKRSF